MLNKTSLLIFIAFILLLNVLIYLIAYYSIYPTDLIFAECARNSGRTSALINLILLFMIGYYGLKSIYKSEVKKNIFHILITSFAVNHIIHLFFVSQFFKDQVMELSVLENLHGFITFIFLIGLPILLLAYDKLNKLIYSLIILNLINVTYFISITFYSRVKPADDAYLHQVGILIMIIAVLYMLFRVFKENRSVNNS